jgi:hypothetical protein
MCFVVYKATSEQEHAILTTLYLADAKNTNKLSLDFSNDMSKNILDLYMGSS